MSWQTRYFRCPDLTYGKSFCEFGCTRNRPICHMYAQGKCYWQHCGHCYKGWHFDPTNYEAGQKERSAKRSYQQERTQTPEREEPQRERPQMNRKRTRDLHITLENEANLQIALARLKLETHMPDMAMLNAAYKQEMSYVSNTLPATELGNKARRLTWAFRFVEAHIESQ